MKKFFVFVLSLVLLLCVAAPGLAAPPAWLSQGAFAAHPKAADILPASDGTQFMPVSKDYVVFKQQNGNYIVFQQDNAWGYAGQEAPEQPLFRIEKDSRHRTTALYMYATGASGPVYRVHGDAETGALAFYCVGSSVSKHRSGDPIEEDSSAYKRLKQRYETHFEKGLGLSAFNEGNIMKDQDWVKIAEKGDVSATVRFTRSAS